MEVLFAPLEGITYSEFRIVHHSLFPGAAEYYTPFIAPDSSGTFKPKYLRELTQDKAAGVPLVPQLMANNPGGFLVTAHKLADLGFNEVNLNAGCPSGTVFKKHKGSGMLLDLDSLRRFLDEVFSRCPVKISIKTRMGIESTAEFSDILSIYTAYPLSRLIIHARDRLGMYRSVPDLAGFAEAFPRCPFPVTYNGEILSADDLSPVISACPELRSVMCGRGAAANPALLREISGGKALPAEELKSFCSALPEAYLSGGLSPAFTLQRMKFLWHYMIFMFDDCRREEKAILKSSSLAEYNSAVFSLFSYCQFNPSGKYREK